MTKPHLELREEIGRIRRVADMLCTGHASLRDRFVLQALMLDLSILVLTAWLVALAFVEPRINVSLTPFNLDPQLWGGLLAVLTFCLSILQVKVEWKGRADGHKRSLDIYAEVKREAGYLLASSDGLDENECRRVLARFDMASATGIEISEREFLRQKQRHRIKLALSRHLDDFPSASIALTRIRFWMRDNLRKGNGDGEKP